jgi:hypothetical protein
MRFSLRLLLVAFGIFAVLLYVFIVRPTVIAEKFIVAVSRQDFDAAKVLVKGEYSWRRLVEQANLPQPDHVYADLIPREWQDIWRGRRRIVLRVARHNDYRGGHVEWTEDTEIIAGIRGLRADLPSHVDYNWPAIVQPKSAIEHPEKIIRLEPNTRTG